MKQIYALRLDIFIALTVQILVLCVMTPCCHMSRAMTPTVLSHVTCHDTVLSHRWSPVLQKNLLHKARSTKMNSC